MKPMIAHAAYCYKQEDGYKKQIGGDGACRAEIAEGGAGGHTVEEHGIGIHGGEQQQKGGGRHEKHVEDIIEGVGKGGAVLFPAVKGKSGAHNGENSRYKHGDYAGGEALEGVIQLGAGFFLAAPCCPDRAHRL